MKPSPGLPHTVSAAPRATSTVPRAKSAMDLWLGQQLRQLRKSQRKPMASVAAACGMSVGLLSQIERGLSSVSVHGLHRLARELNVPVDALLRNAAPGDGEAEGRVARAGSHRLLHLDDKGITKEIVTPPCGRDLMLCRVIIAPGGSTGDQPFCTDKGEQVGLVLSGTLELWIEHTVVLVRAGDSFCFDSRSPRRWRNPGDTVTEVVWVISNIAASADPP